MIEDRYRYKSTEVAFYIAAKANEQHYGINITKVLKLLYIVYGVYLAVKEERLTDEHPQAWPYGPVFPSARLELKKVRIEDIRMSDSKINLNDIANDSEINQYINLVLNTFGKYFAGQLTRWSHRSGSPWDETVNLPGFQWGDCIPDSYIKKYFDSILIRKK